MNEQEAYREAVRDQIVNNDRILMQAAKPKQKPQIAWRRVLIPVMTALVVALGLTMAIPSARAEVLRWFSPKNAGEYIASDPEEREPIEELEHMIAKPETSTVDIKVNYVADEPYWREIGENFSVSFGETIYDGEYISILMDFDGLSGYAVVENGESPEIPAGTGVPLLLAEKLDPEMVRCFRDDYADLSRYLDGSLEVWQGPDNYVRLTLEDGSTWYRRDVIVPTLRPSDKPFFDSIRELYYKVEPYTEEEAQTLRTSLWEYVQANGLRAIAKIYLPNGEDFTLENGKKIADYLDENGNLKAHVNYCVSIDHGEETETKMDIDLGTVLVNMTAYRDLKQRSIVMPQGEIALSGDAVIGIDGWDAERYDFVANRSITLDGVTLRVVNPGEVDLRGVRDIRVLVSMPKEWSEEQKTALAQNLDFDLCIDGERIYCGYGLSPERYSTGDYMLILEISDIPFDRINAMQTITLTPVLSRYTNAVIQRTLPDGKTETVRTVPIAEDGTFDTRTLERGTPVMYESDTTAHPEWTITLKIN